MQALYSGCDLELRSLGRRFCFALVGAFLEKGRQQILAEIAYLHLEAQVRRIEVNFRISRLEPRALVAITVVAE